MESGIALSWAWGIGLIGFAFGVACGVAIGYMTLCNNRRSQQLQEKCDALQRDFDAYRGQVGQHFLRTSELVQQMTDSYREVYEHLATGSQALCETPVSPPRLDIPDQPVLETAKSGKAPDAFSDAETNGLAQADSDDYLGDSPRVPTLDMDIPEEQPQATRRTPSR
jgi:uncharacterized membrane-anchored protein YhcB (DUF1043 family)